MPERRLEAIKVEGGVGIGGKVVFDDPYLFTKTPKISIIAKTTKIVLVTLTSRSKTNFKYKIRQWNQAQGKWKNKTSTIKVIWLAIQEK